MINEELKNRIFSKLTGEGGLNSDFAPDAVSKAGRWEDKEANLDKQQILARIITDDVFFDVLATKIIDRYDEICAKRGLAPDKYFDRVMTPYDCCTWACFFGKQMIADENQVNRRGR